MATRKNTVKAASPAFDEVELANHCYDALALLAGVRSILSEVEEQAVPDPDGHQHADRLLDYAMGHVKEVAHAIALQPAEAANG